MLTIMTEEDWTIVLRAFEALQSRRGDKGRDDRKFLEALHYFVVHSITWRALPENFGHWSSVWKRFWRLSRTGTFEAFFEALAAMSETAHLLQMFDSTVVRAHVSAAGAKGGKMIKRNPGVTVPSRVLSLGAYLPRASPPDRPSLPDPRACRSQPCASGQALRSSSCIHSGALHHRGPAKA
jgi:transposase